MELKVNVRYYDDIPVINAVGEIDVITAKALKSAALELLEPGNCSAIINLDHVEYIDSNGLGVIVALLRSASDKSARLCLSFTNPMIERLFSITGLDQVTPLARTDAEACRLLNQPPQGLLSEPGSAENATHQQRQGQRH